MMLQAYGIDFQNAAAPKKLKFAKSSRAIQKKPIRRLDIDAKLHIFRFMGRDVLDK